MTKKYEITARRIMKALSDNNMRAQDLANATGINKASISQYVNGSHAPSNINAGKMGEVLHVSPLWLMGFDVSPNEDKPAAATGHDMSALPKQILEQLKPVKMKSFPMLGYVACGEPIFADKNFEAFVMADADIDADYCLTCKGDSMINARIHDGDIVFIKTCSMVDNGDIALVVIDNDVTLKRVYYYPEQQTLKLVSENPLYAPFVYSGAELEQIHILGKAVMFQSIVR